MAIPWLSVLKVVPWSDVISNAPVVADGAKKLWHMVTNRAVASAADAGTTPPNAPLAEPVTLQSLQMRLDQAQVALDSLHQQMLGSSELIKSLAEQNTQLIERMELLRRRVRRLGWGAAALAALVMYAIAKII